jgi:anaerobic selenocysteine-containing dehydrogenase
MSDPSLGNSRVSRRDFLFAAAVSGGAVVAASLVAAPAAASNKIPQKTVNYQPTPKGGQRCDNCALWQDPSACKLVDGKIDASGWCVLYKKK